MEQDHQCKCSSGLHCAVRSDSRYDTRDLTGKSEAENRFTELLVDMVDVILEGSGIDEKFLGVTLFALVPNTTEFLNAISFAMNGNIALR